MDEIIFTHCIYCKTKKYIDSYYDRQKVSRENEDIPEALLCNNCINNGIYEIFYMHKLISNFGEKIGKRITELYEKDENILLTSTELILSGKLLDVLHYNVNNLGKKLSSIKLPSKY